MFELWVIVVAAILTAWILSAISVILIVNTRWYVKWAMATGQRYMDMASELSYQSLEDKIKEV